MNTVLNYFHKFHYINQIHFTQHTIYYTCKYFDNQRVQIKITDFKKYCEIDKEKANTKNSDINIININNK